MAVRDIAKQVIDALPDDASMDDIIHALYLRTKLERGLREVREGKGIPHEDAASPRSPGTPPGSPIPPSRPRRSGGNSSCVHFSMPRLCRRPI
jgi:hypothetical protein